jgi:signal transduction histidine kinase
LFEETASREGLIENEALRELKDFVFKALTASRLRIAEKIKIKRDALFVPPEPQPNPFINPHDKFRELLSFISQTQNNSNAIAALEYIETQIKNLLEEMGMLRVLAGLGLTIAEFTHEIIQYTPSINGYLYALGELQNDPKGIELIEKLTRSFKHFTSYTSYFNATVSQNVSRELKPILLSDVVRSFIDIINPDANKQNIAIKQEYFGYDLFTIPMHPSEWGSILFNLYTNSKKAIRRAGTDGRIQIICGKKDAKVYLEFLDNGDGVPDEISDRIFNAFFTTSTPAGLDASKEDRLTGTGLGLKIVRDIVEAYGGKIFLTKAELEYVTSFRIELPEPTKEQLKDYGR